MFNAVEAYLQKGTKATYYFMCPQGERFTQKKAEELAEEEDLVFLCGHYEGYDERIREHLVTDEISIGDFVLTGGELAAMTVVDSVVRLITGCVRTSRFPYSRFFFNWITRTSTLYKSS